MYSNNLTYEYGEMGSNDSLASKPHKPHKPVFLNLNLSDLKEKSSEENSLFDSSNDQKMCRTIKDKTSKLCASSYHVCKHPLICF